MFQDCGMHCLNAIKGDYIKEEARDKEDHNKYKEKVKEIRKEMAKKYNDKNNKPDNGFLKKSKQWIFNIINLIEMA